MVSLIKTGFPLFRRSIMTVYDDLSEMLVKLSNEVDKKVFIFFSFIPILQKNDCSIKTHYIGHIFLWHP